MHRLKRLSTRLNLPLLKFFSIAVQNQFNDGAFQVHEPPDWLPHRLLSSGCASLHVRPVRPFATQSRWSPPPAYGNRYISARSAAPFFWTCRSFATDGSSDTSVHKTRPAVSWYGRYDMSSSSSARMSDSTCCAEANPLDFRERPDVQHPGTAAA
jgi:hypothetical protein